MAVDVDTLERVVNATGRLVAGIREDQLEAPTPCDEWAVRDLLSHLVGTTQMFIAAARGEPSDGQPFAFPADAIASDVAASYDEATSAAVASWRNRGLDGLVTLPPGDMPAEVAISIEFTDNLVHAWDLAQATQQRFDLDPHLVEHAWEFLNGNISDGSRGEGGMFGHAVTVADDAAALDRLLAYSGRTP